MRRPTLRAAERQAGAEHAAEPPARHLPRRPRPLPEPEVGDERGEGADGEARAPARARSRRRSTMSVVGLTLGKAAKAIRPAIASAASAATRATTCDGGRERSYQAKPASRTRAEDQEAGQLPAHQPSPPRRAAAAPCSGVTTPGRSRTRATSVAKYQPPERISRGRAVGDHDAVAEQDDALGEGGGELDVVGGDDHRRRRAPASRSIRLDEVALAGAVHPPGRLVERDQPGQPLALHPARQGDRQRQPLPLAAGEVAGVGVDRVLQADDPQRCQPPPPAARRRPARGPGSRRGSGSAGRCPPAPRPSRAPASTRPAAVRSSVLLPAPLRPISATRSPRPTVRSMPSQDVARLVPGVELDPQIARLERCVEAERTPSERLNFSGRGVAAGRPASPEKLSVRRGSDPHRAI